MNGGPSLDVEAQRAQSVFRFFEPQIAPIDADFFNHEVAKDTKKNLALQTLLE